MGKKVIVVSGVNLVDAGPLSVYLDFLNALIKNSKSEDYRIIALVGKKELFSQFENEIELIEFRDSKSSWIKRLYLEYFGFLKLSKRISVDIWISMHDITPNVIAKHKYVYCHNPSPFNKMSIKDARFGVKYYLFSKFYKYLYMINIKKNDAVIVQQEWMRKEFVKMYHPKEVIVARPSLPQLIQIKNETEDNCIFVCPSFPRYYKNFEVSCKAARLLNERGERGFKLYITIKGDENKYAQFLKDKYSEVESIRFCGLLPREELFELFSRSSCMIFMSKLETWGMPITEYKMTGKPMILSNLPYAMETAGQYTQVQFVDSDNDVELANAMQKIINKETISRKVPLELHDNPYAENWEELIEYLVK